MGRRLWCAVGLAFWAQAPAAQRPGAPSTGIVRWSVTADLRIGDDEAGEAYEFTNIFAAVQSQKGRVFVTQSGDQAIRVFDRNGRHLRTIGRSGGGPGEFRAPPSIGLIGDTLWAYDLRLRRLSLFSSEGTMLGTIPSAPQPMRQSREDVVFSTIIAKLLHDGHAIAMGSWSLPVAPGGPARANAWLHVTRAGAVKDTIAWVRARSPMVLSHGQGDQLARAHMTQPFNDEPLVAIVAPTGVVLIIERDVPASIQASRLIVRALSSTGDTLWVRDIPYQPRRLDAHVVDSVVTGIHEAFLKQRAPYTERQIRGAMFIPEFFPTVTGVVVGDDGTVWLRREDIGITIDYTVLSAKGAVLASLTLPRTVRPRWISGDVLWASETSEDDVPLLVRYRINRRRIQ